MINKAISIIKEYLEELRIYKDLFQTKVKIVQERSYLLQNRNKSLVIVGIMLMIHLLLATFYISYAYYYTEDSLILINAKVGNRLSTKYDYSILVYVENTNEDGLGNGTYRLSSNIPQIGYRYVGYNCINDSILYYDNELKVTDVTIDKNDSCSVYFNVVSTKDVSIEIMLETAPESNEYILSSIIPAYGYKYSYYECANNAKIEYKEDTHKVSLTTKGKDYCKVYFKRENADIQVKLYLEDKFGSNTYVERESIVPGNRYFLNEDKSYCQNSTGKLNSNIEYKDGYINIDLESNATCNIYLNLTE